MSTANHGFTPDQRATSEFAEQRTDYGRVLRAAAALGTMALLSACSGNSSPQKDGFNPDCSKNPHAANVIFAQHTGVSQTESLDGMHIPRDATLQLSLCEPGEQANVTFTEGGSQSEYKISTEPGTDLPAGALSVPDNGPLTSFTITPTSDTIYYQLLVSK
ncbi:MAG TPA: hypothetical protein VFH39_01335 [Candidatus Saccharimonadales bacterium]|nr:hypothetical protein [Candidatus Saccharimonadales bacterium]